MNWCRRGLASAHRNPRSGTCHEVRHANLRFGPFHICSSCGRWLRGGRAFPAAYVGAVFCAARFCRHPHPQHELRSGRSDRPIRLHGWADPLRRHRHHVLGCRRHAGRRGHRAAARLSRSQHPALVQLRPSAAAAHVGRRLRLRRQCADLPRLSMSCSAPAAPGCSAAISPGSCSGATSFSSSWPRPATCSASPRAANTPSPNGMSTSG